MAYQTFDNLESYKAAFKTLDWNTDPYKGYVWKPFADVIYDADYTGDMTIGVGEFTCPSEFWTQKNSREKLLNAWLPTIVDNKNVTPIRIKLWAKDEGQLLFGHANGSWVPEFKCRIEVMMHGSIIPIPLAITAIVIILGLAVTSPIWKPVLMALIHTADKVIDVVDDVTEAVKGAAKDIGKNILPLALIVCGTIVTVMYFSSKKSSGVKI